VYATKIKCFWMVVFSSYFILSSAGCGEATPTIATEESAVEKLSMTGLYQDIKKGILAKGVVPFTPQFVLWTDGAKKKRWIYLPPGAKIDSSNMDVWKFPVGTKLWKEFARDGKRVETRLLHKVKDGVGMQGWIMVAYIWNAQLTDATISKPGGQNQGGTPHDVPSAADCTLCHGGRESVSLGFSAIQLSHNGKGMQIPTMIKEGRFTHPPKGIFKIPGNAVEREALGYLHANCSHCHNRENKNPHSNPLDEIQMYLHLNVGDLAKVQDTETYKSAVRPNATNLGPAVPGSPERSRIIRFMEANGNGDNTRMPPLGTELLDQKAITLIKSWIENIKP